MLSIIGLVAIVAITGLNVHVLTGEGIGSSHISLENLVHTAFASPEDDPPGCSASVLCCDCTVGANSYQCSISCTGENNCTGSYYGSTVTCDGNSYDCNLCDDNCDPCF